MELEELRVLARPRARCSIFGFLLFLLWPVRGAGFELAGCTGEGWNVYRGEVLEGDFLRILVGLRGLHFCCLLFLGNSGFEGEFLGRWVGFEYWIFLRD